MHAAIDSYKALTIDMDRLAYYEGWQTASKEGRPVFWSLHGFYNAYGPELTDQLWGIIKRQCATERGKSARGRSSILSIMLSYITELCPTRADFDLAGRSQCINDFTISLYCARLLDVTARGLCTKAFHRQEWSKWLQTIQLYFIKPGIWSEPAYELFCPPYSTSSTRAGTHEHVDSNGNAFNDKLVTHIPLSYSDDTAISALLDNIKSDIEHVVITCQRLAKTTIHKARRRKALAAEGAVKPFMELGAYHTRKNDPDYVDLTLPENLCATWEHYAYNYPGKDLGEFLKIRGSLSKFATDYGTLQSATLYPFLLLLINEHPLITDSWLLNLELFDKNGKEKGFRHSGNVWIATSIKPRKGVAKAQQTITLNDVSKSLFDNIIELTAKERQ